MIWNGFVKMVVYIGMCCNLAFSYGQKPIDARSLADVDFLFMMEHCTFVFADDTLSAQDILENGAQDWFRLGATRYANMGMTDKTLWMKFSIENTSPDSIALGFVFGNHTVNKLKFYENTPTGIQKINETGSEYPFHSRAYPLFVFTFPLTFQPGESKEYLLSINRKGQLVMFIPLLLTMQKLKMKSDRSYFAIGIYSGILLLCSAFNLFLYAILKARIHLLYFFYSLVSIWCILSLETMDFQFIFPNHPDYLFFSRYASNWLYFGLLLAVMQLFLGQSASNSRYYGLVNITKWVCMSMFVLEWVMGVPNWPESLKGIRYTLSEAMTLSCILLVVLSCVEKIRQGVYLAWFYLSAIFTMIIGVLLALANVRGLTAWYQVVMPPTPVETALVIEAIIICFGILYRYNLFKREKDQLALELQQEKANSAQEILRVEEQEKKRFAQNLHDELGGNLAALKMAVQRLDVSKEQTDILSQLVDRTAEATRNIAHDIMPPEFEETDIQRLLALHFQRLNIDSKPHFDFHATLKSGQLTKQQELIVYRIVLELSANIIKHAHATSATIQLISYDECLEIMVEDNGIGFDPSAIRTGMGLKNMYSRVQFFNGQLTIDAGEKGSTIIIKLPTKRL